ncbi:hypothetical protein DPMN_105864 [Dreissena polymorpha]|uniref:Uncharacterized protein n=1 Tax=Dreissena polymorpha TaxID=45954 RepID=A0A9D4K424_DREPO|nr:hypothetical protein DPMN_105864 [Dreissena polymorpha]
MRVEVQLWEVLVAVPQHLPSLDVGGPVLVPGLDQRQGTAQLGGRRLLERGEDRARPV